MLPEVDWKTGGLPAQGEHKSKH
jgi:tyrosyl-tRNA synthetase